MLKLNVNAPIFTPVNVLPTDMNEQAAASKKKKKSKKKSS